MSNTTVSVTVQDPSGQAWEDGEISYSIAAQKPILFNGVELADQYFENNIVPLDNTGSATFSLPDCAQLTPSGTLWRITVSPYAYTTGITFYLYITGSTMNISTEINSVLEQPTVLPALIPFAYRDSNVQLQVGTGEMYWDNVTQFLRLYNGTAWVNIGGGGGGGGITGLNQDVLAGVSPFTAATCVMVHAHDTQTPNNTLTIDAEQTFQDGPASVGLYAANPAGTNNAGALEIGYDSNKWGWALHINGPSGSAAAVGPFDTYVMNTSMTVDAYLTGLLSGLTLVSGQTFIFSTDYEGSAASLVFNKIGVGWIMAPLNNSGGIEQYINLLSSQGVVIGYLTGTTNIQNRFIIESLQNPSHGSAIADLPLNSWQLYPAAGDIQAAGFDVIINPAVVSGSVYYYTPSRFLGTTAADPTHTYGICFDPTGVMIGTNEPTIYARCENSPSSPNVSLALMADIGIDFYLGFTKIRTITNPALNAATLTLGTPGQNTTKQMQHISGFGTVTGGSGDSQISVSIGPSSASTVIYENTMTGTIANEPVGFAFVVPPGWFYVVNGSGHMSPTASAQILNF